MNIQTLLNSLTKLDPSWVLWLLVVLSVIAGAVILERVAYLCGTAEDLQRLRTELFDQLERGVPEAARKQLEARPSSEARIVAAALGPHSALAAEKCMLAEGELQRLRLERRLTYLGTLGNNAPFIGLLGTVLGIIGAFQELDTSQGRLSDGLMSQVGHALLATAVGLLVALPAVAAFNTFHRVIHVRLGRALALGSEVIAYRRASDGHAQGRAV